VRRAARAALLAFALGAGSAAAQPVEARDDDGRTVTLAAPARRVVTLAPFLTELVYDVGSGARLVAVSEHSDWPPAARALPEVGNAFDFSLERIASLQPDLVLVWKDSVRASDIERMEGFGAHVFVASARSLEDVPRLLGLIARLTGGSAEAVAARYRAKLDALREAHRSARHMHVFLEIWHQPLTTVAGRHFMNEALETCAADNVFADLPGVAPTVPWEAVYARDPEAIVSISSGTTKEAFHAAWGERRALSAVKNGKLVFVDPDKLQRQSARTADGVAELCAALDRIR
jgi:iron complex transport system substrate-binding protein